MFHKKLAGIILKKAKVDVAGYVKDMTNKDIDRIVKVIKECQFLIKGLDSFDKSQVTVGGVDIKEIVQETMEVRKPANLYVCGEIIDVDGDCGGFNLQWAWTSAYTAAKAIAKKISAESIEYYDR
jgi:predicted flavoprotein YhiN